MASKQVDKIVKILQKALRVPVPLSGKILNINEHVATIAAVWSQASPDREVSVHSETLHIVDLKEKVVRNFAALDTTTELLTSYSPSNTYRAVLRDVPSASNKQTKKQILEIWSNNMLWKSFDLVKFEKHGDVYTDGEFGCLEWSPCETKLLYVAEKKTPKSEPFLGPGSKKSSEASVGTEFDFIEDWGETLVGKSQPIIGVCDIETEVIDIISEGIEGDEQIENEDKWSYGQAVWAPDGASIVCVAWDNKPRRLGLVYCTNRRSYIVHICDTNGTKTLRKLSDNGKAVRSPIFSPDMSKLVWIERDVTGPHHACHRIVKYDWDSKKRSIVVDIIDKEMKTENDQVFYGMYNLSMNRPWLCDSKTLIVSTPQRASIRMFKIDTDTGKITDISDCHYNEETHSSIVLDVSRDLILSWRSSMGLTPSLQIGITNSESNLIDWITFTPHNKIIEGYHTDVIRLKASRTTDAVRDFSTIYFGPPQDSEVKDIPLIVWPHGGPHSANTNSYSTLFNFFAQQGFAILLVNYRGSIGAGQSSVDWLPGRVGTSDVEDVHQAALHVLHKYGSQLDPSKTVLFGGSHGGFLVLHLAGQYPTSYHCVTALNPVSDLTSFSSSDIPDWALVEGGFKYDEKKYELSEEEHEAMRTKSPMAHIDNICVPVLFLLGKKDLRVPMSQGLAFYHALKARNIKTRAIIYEDNHGLIKVPHLIDFSINTANWFLQYIPHKLS